MTAIISIYFNQPDFLIWQYEQLKKHCKESFELIAIDNSSDNKAADSIKYHAVRLGIKYVRVKSMVTDPSQSHVFATTVALNWLQGRNYGNILWLDHDAMPIKDFNTTELLEGNEVAGIPQERNGITYLWPGCFLHVNHIVPDFGLIPGCDTGAKTSELVENNKVKFFDEVHVQNPSSENKYNFYSMIQETFIHFINGSNWAGTDKHQERLNSLYNLLK